MLYLLRIFPFIITTWIKWLYQMLSSQLRLSKEIRPSESFRRILTCIGLPPWIFENLWLNYSTTTSLLISGSLSFECRCERSECTLSDSLKGVCKGPYRLSLALCCLYGGIGLMTLTGSTGKKVGFYSRYMFVCLCVCMKTNAYVYIYVLCVCVCRYSFVHLWFLSLLYLLYFLFFC